MSPPAIFFFAVLASQLGFVAALLFLVIRRFPERLPVYRWIAPAAVPLLLFALATFAYVRITTSLGLPVDKVPLEPVARLFLAYAVLWLVGVLFAGLLIRWMRRR
jgi:hypothetical protein